MLLGAGPNPVFTLVQPTAVTGSYTQSNATCSSPGDGSLTATVDQGSGTYNYFLYLNGSLLNCQSGSFFTNWEVDGLAPGVYNLQVLDAARPTCAGYAATVTIGGPPALGLTVLQQTDVSCYGMSTGSISLLGSGGMNIYSYTITNPTTGASYSNTTGVFTDLAAGSYTAVVQSAVSGCGDQYTYPQPVVVSQPADLQYRVEPDGCALLWGGERKHWCDDWRRHGSAGADLGNAGEWSLDGDRWEWCYVE